MASKRFSATQSALYFSFERVHASAASCGMDDCFILRCPGRLDIERGTPLMFLGSGRQRPVNHIQRPITHLMPARSTLIRWKDNFQSRITGQHCILKDRHQGILKDSSTLRNLLRDGLIRWTACDWQLQNHKLVTQNHRIKTS